MKRNRRRIQIRRAQQRRQPQRRPPGGGMAQIRPPQQAQVAQPSYMTPFSAQAETQIGALNQNYGDATADFNYQEQQARQQYGLDPGHNDPTTNPYSRAALLEKSFHEAGRSNTNNYASQGQLYAGSLQNAQNTAQGSYLQNRDSLAQDYQNTKYKIAQGRLQAQRDRDQGTAAAHAGALEDALGQDPEPAAWGGGGGGRRPPPRRRPRRPPPRRGRR